ncbi:MAG: hypothetical protein UT39_C0010G0018 [Candidatus Woesebacteria bacterium GW2011_GWA1_39_21]|uniref:Uncharacterized protein n=1 Tax=Candidatus Woesebacteria bacterium GW2011_GWA1_39_21 TaxID=1618550 RepID=A0A0G0QLD1_9BACT|nr:MAG: hypothetical protein UT39_C0010G0018 [Candidatus Woesebacteria bacterium GW2011_GWA1_39_21]
MKRRKPVDQRITIEVDGQPRRLDWIAENKPQVLAKLVLGGGLKDERDPEGNTTLNPSVAWSALYKRGWTRQTVFDKCKEWGLDAGILGHIERE